MRIVRDASWRRSGIWVLVATLSLELSLPIILAADHWALRDWDLMVDAGQRIVSGQNPYYASAGLHGGTWRYSPLLAYGFAFIEPVGRTGWAIAPFAMLPLVRDWRLIAIFLLSYPFWRDVQTGLSFVEIPLVALIALRGSYAGSLTLIGLAVLMPRPMMIPLVGWLLWKEPRLGPPALLVAGVLLVGSFATGWGAEWVAHLMNVAGATERGQMRITNLLGPLWLLMLPLAGWLMLRGRLGLAALAISPYWTPAYPMLLVLELPFVRRMLGGNRTVYPRATK